MTDMGTHEHDAQVHYDAHKKSTLLTYVLWFFLGTFGVHRLYLGRFGSAILMALCTLIGGALWATFILIPFAIVPLAVVGIMWVWDLFAIPSMVEQRNLEYARRIGLPPISA